MNKENSKKQQSAMPKTGSLEELAVKAQQGDKQAFMELWQSFLPLVKKCAAGQYIRSFYDDAVSEAEVALTEAVYNYDFAVNPSFAGYAATRVRFAVWNLFKRERKQWQHEVTGDALRPDGSGLTVLEGTASNESVEQEIEHKVLGEGLVKMLDDFPIKQRQAVLYTIWLHLSLKEAAALMEISPQAVFALKKRAVENLRRKLK